MFRLPNNWRDGRVVSVVHPGEEVVLDLVVETPVQLAEPPAAHVGGGDYLQTSVSCSFCIIVSKE